VLSNPLLKIEGTGDGHGVRLEKRLSAKLATTLRPLLLGSG
jgi:hypothetical protein